MNSQFCKVGKIRPEINKVFSLKELEEKYVRFMEEAYNLEYTDMSLSDILLYEAHKLKQRILNLKKANTKDLDVAF
ncbi:Lacal_2735 family protein [uncultured Psychroserpens sp.]|uniref:Lacal_2735 family protein n=1 Tax=uncultured Psychroserpens sp. TaxID=255436 RepID=UPI0026034823|nr:Lacal_2735 family protein [uncultured Psychroserpens sp.]